jgi:REP-associated tyrosine transposase
MIVGYHSIFCTYGFWLPNDPRGSWSDFVGSWDLFRYGAATKTNARRSVAGAQHDRALRSATKRALKRPAVEFSGVQARAVGRGIAKYAARTGLEIWACAIMPDHVHLVTGCAPIDIEQVVIQLKGEATGALVAEGIHPFQDIFDARGRRPKCFARRGWNVFLDPDDVLRAIRYVEENPIKEGLPRQKWAFAIDCPEYFG